MPKSRSNEGTMIAQISEGAGEVWRYLNANGATAPAALKKELKLSTEAFYGALGWLAREDKISVNGAGRRATVALK
jgi:winged helix-turn-helix protein DUF2582